MVNPIQFCYRRFVLLVMQSRLYAWVLRHFIPYIRFTLYYTSLRGWKYQRGYTLLSPGDIILTRDNRKLSSFLIPGNLVHAALCVAKGPGVEFEVAEMTHLDYTKSAFFDICKESDRVVIMTCTGWDADYKKVVIEHCLSFEDVDYDVEFKLGVKALYCSELITACDPEDRLQVDYSDLVGIGQEYVSAEDIYNADNTAVIWDSDLEREKTVLDITAMMSAFEKEKKEELDKPEEFLAKRNPWELEPEWPLQ